MTKTKLSKAVLALIVAGAGSGAILSQFLDEKEGERLQAYQDGAGVWTICKGHTEGVKPGDRATVKQCADFFASDVGKSFATIDRLVKVPLTEPQRAGITSFCAYNIGPGNCARSTFLKKLNAGDLLGACNEIPKWKYVGGVDCTKPGNKTCGGIPERRAAERELCLWTQ